MLNKEEKPVFLSEVIFDGQTEQGVEFDYILPDYYPDIFKIVKCCLTPKIVSYSISGDSKLVCDGIVYIKVFYLGDSSNVLNCIEQRFTYSKIVELGKNSADNVIGSPVISIIPKVDYCNCRAVSGRRIDIRGAVSCKVKVTGTRAFKIISDACGDGVETKKQSIMYSGERLTGTKQFTVREDIETGAGSGGIGNMLRCDAVGVISDIKVIPNKVILKGNARVKACYTLKDGGDTTVAEVMEADIPMSQIVDIDGITDEYMCFADMNIMTCDLAVKQDSSGENRIFGCDILAEFVVTANRESEASIVTDAYCTNYECSLATAGVKLETEPKMLNEQLVHKTSLSSEDGEIETVYDAWCDLQNVICRGKSPTEMVVSGQMIFQVLAKNTSGTPIFLEKQEPFETEITVDGLSPDCVMEHSAAVNDVSYSLGQNSIDCVTRVNFKGCLYKMKNVDVIKEITINEEKPKQRETEFALKLYYPEPDEEIWGIAKRFNTSAAAIIAENEIDGDRAAGGLLLIPCI